MQVPTLILKENKPRATATTEQSVRLETQIQLTEGRVNQAEVHPVKHCMYHEKVSVM